jgi:hypothetical protein
VIVISTAQGKFARKKVGHHEQILVEALARRTNPPVELLAEFRPCDGPLPGSPVQVDTRGTGAYNLAVQDQWAAGRQHLGSRGWICWQRPVYD